MTADLDLSLAVLSKLEAQLRAIEDEVETKRAIVRQRIVDIATSETRRKHDAVADAKRRASAAKRAQAHELAERTFNEHQVAKLACTVKIPLERQKEFGQFLRAALEWEILSRTLKPSRIAPAKAAQIVKTGRAFIRAMETVTSWNADDYRVIYEAKESAQRLISTYARGRGRTRKTAEHPRFAEVAREIIATVKRLGGELTLTRKSGTGTLIDLIKALRPLFPSGFIPDPLPVAMLEQQLRAARRSAAVDRDSAKNRY